MSANAQEMLIEIFRTIERVNGSCTITEAREAARAVRSISFSNAQAGKWLEKFARPSDAIRGPEGRFQGRGRKTDGSADGPRTEARTENQAQTDGSADGPRTEARTASRAHSKVLPSKTNTDQSDCYVANATPQSPADEPPKPETAVREKRSRRGPSERDLAAWALLDEAVEIVFEYARPMLTAEEWRKRNKRGALALVDANATTADVARLLLIAYTHPEAKKYYGGLTRLEKLADAWQRLEDFASAATRGDGPDVHEHAGRSHMPEVLDYPGRAEDDARILAERALREAKRVAWAASAAAEYEHHAAC